MPNSPNLHHKNGMANSKPWFFNALTPMSDQDRISPYNINAMSSRQVMRMNKNKGQEIIS